MIQPANTSPRRDYIRWSTGNGSVSVGEKIFMANVVMKRLKMAQPAEGHDVAVSPAMAVMYCFAVTVVAFVIGVINVLFLLFTPLTAFS
jgi:hypothetical protein